MKKSFDFAETNFVSLRNGNPCRLLSERQHYIFATNFRINDIHISDRLDGSNNETTSQLAHQHKELP